MSDGSERFLDFERSVLQDNIALCDTKSGVLLAFTGALAILCVDAVTHVAGAVWLGRWRSIVGPGAFGIAAVPLLVSCAYSLWAVRPRLVRANGDDHIFWESPSLTGSVEAYADRVHHLCASAMTDEKLRHLHTLAGICRAKYRHLRRAMDLAAVGFVVLVVAEIAKG
jgi:hypothetical protein